MHRMAQTKAGISCSRHLIMRLTMVVFTFIFFQAKPARSVTTQSLDKATVIEMHGSGTTNPSKYFWKAMDRLEERARKPVRMTYRGVGSTTGQVEFIGYDQATATTQGTTVNVTNPVSDFGSADIPLNATQYRYFQNASMSVVQVPFQLGAVSFFHNVDADDLGISKRLNLTACTLAKIFLRQITKWDDAVIMAENPTLTVPSNQPITIVHRSDGSSSTSGITGYLSVACPSIWTGGPTSGASLFPDNATYALPKQGSGNVANAIASNQYSIGYIDAGHGQELGFQEISLTNAHGQTLISSEADIPKAATVYGALPAIDADWSAVSLINLAGENVWPITAFTYIYARTDKTNYGGQLEVAKLVKSFILYCLSAEGQAMVPEFAFYPLDSTTLQSVVSQVTTKLNADVWTFETSSSTQSSVGMNVDVFSGKRQSYGDYERELLVSKVATLETSVANLQSMETIPVHGSGTTNPSKFFWKLMDTLEERSRIHLSMSYRAVGSGTGIKEFVGASNGYESFSHFGSGDIPVPTADYTTLNTEGKGFITIPFQLGAIGFFHNIPGISEDKALDLKPCVLARIFTTNITTWDHADILASNPGFSPPAGQKITVVRRIYGSSSTSLISAYLYKVCPNDWTIGVGGGNAAASNKSVPTAAPFWTSTTVAAEGSGGVSDAISSTAYSIGYIDSGHGHALGLAEVALQNKDGNYLKSEAADIAGAVTQIMSVIPNADGDWANSNLSLLDLPGEKTWPIVAFSYLFIRKDLTNTGRTGPAIKAFAEIVLSAEGQGMLEEFGFEPVPAAIIAKGIAGLTQLKFSASATMFIHETSTLAGTGMGLHVLSVKRSRWSDLERAQLVADFEALKISRAQILAEFVQFRNESVTRKDIEELAIPALVFAVIAFIMIVSSLILGGTACTFSRRHERFFNEDEMLRDKYATRTTA